MADPAWDDTQPVQAQPTQPVAQNQQAPASVPTWDSTQDVAEAQAPYQTPGQRILGGVEAVGKGVLGPIFTGAEKVASQYGVPGLTAKEQAMREAANPIEHGALEASALIGSSLLDFGLGSALNVVGHGVEAAIDLQKGASLGARVATKAAASAAEMAAFQTQEEVSRQINDPQMTAAAMGSAAINIGLSGIIGGVTGAGLGAVKPLWQSMIGDKADAYLALLQDKKNGIGVPIDSSFQAFLDGEKAAGRTVSPEIMGSFTESPTMQKMFQSLRESGSDAAAALNQTIDATKAGAEKQITETLGENGLSAYDAGAKAKTDIQAKMDELNNGVKEAYAQVGDVNGIQIKDVDKIKFGEKLIEDGLNFGAAQSPEEAMFLRFKDRVQAQNTIGQLDKLVTEIGSEANAAKISGNFEKARALNQIKQSIAGPDGFIEKQIDKALEEIQPQGQLEQQIHNQLVTENLKSMRTEAKAKYRDFVNNVGDIAGAAKLGKIHSYGQITDALEKIPNERLADRLFQKDNYRALSKLKASYPDIFDTLAQRYKTDILESSSKNGILKHNTVLNKINDLSKETKSLVFKPGELEKIESAGHAIQRLNIRMNPSGTAGSLLKNITGLITGNAAVLGALTHGPAGALVGVIGSQLGKLFGHTVPNNVRLGLLKFLGSEAPINAGALKSTLDYIEQVSKGNKVMGDAVEKIFKSGAQVGNLIPPSLMPNDKSRETLKKHLDAMNANPDSAMSIGGNIGHYMPEHAAAAGTIAASAANYFNSIKPTQPQVSPLDMKQPIDKQAEMKYNRQLDIAEQPLLVFNHIDKGTLQSQDVQTLNTLYPGLHSSIVNKIGQQLIAEQAKGTPIPYHKRMGLSMLMGQPLDSTMTWNAAQSIMHSAQNAQPQQQNQGPQKQHKASGKELTQINKVNSLFATNDERREMSKRS